MSAVGAHSRRGGNIRRGGATAAAAALWPWLWLCCAAAVSGLDALRRTADWRRLASRRDDHKFAAGGQLRGVFDSKAILEQGETRAFLEFLKDIEYDHRQRPEHLGDPTVISVSILVGSVRKVSEVTMDYSVELFFRESWLDRRLQYSTLTKEQLRNKSEIGLHESYAAFLWHPDTFIPNAVESENPKENSITHRSLLRLKPGGEVLYSRRLSVKAECPMDLSLFPFDSQVCKLEQISDGYPHTAVKYEWDAREHTKPVEYDMNKIKLPDFMLDAIVVNHTVAAYKTGNYSRLVCCFFFSRSSGFCFLQLIIPATAVVISSWVSLWMENETTFQDMISVILTLTFLIYSYNTVMPRVSYIKAMDVYLGACFFFVFFSLIKLAIVKYMRQRMHVNKDHSVVCSYLPLVKMSHNPRRNESLPAGVGAEQTYAPPNNVINHHMEHMTPEQQRASRGKNLHHNHTEPVLDGLASRSSSVGNGSATQGGTASKHHLIVHDRESSLPKCRIIENRYFTLTFDLKCMRQFHLLSQIIFPLLFISFCTLYFLLYVGEFGHHHMMCLP